MPDTTTDNKSLRNFLKAAIKYGVPEDKLVYAAMDFMESKACPVDIATAIDAYLAEVSRPAPVGIVPKVGIGVITVSSDLSKVLIMRRLKGHDAGLFCSPGGKVDYGEKAEEAAVREVSEEIGLDIAPQDLIPLGHYDHIDTASNHHYAGPAYLYVMKETDVPVNEEPHKHGDFGLYDIETVKQTFPKTDPLRDGLAMFAKWKTRSVGA